MTVYVSLKVIIKDSASRDNGESVARFSKAFGDDDRVIIELHNPDRTIIVHTGDLIRVARM